MNSLFKGALVFLCFFLLFSCADDTTWHRDTTVDQGVDIVRNRSTNPDPFYDLMYLFDTLGMQTNRSGSYTFIHEVITDLQNRTGSNSLMLHLRQQEIYPCWHCAEPDQFDFPNFYIPFYEISTARLDGILIAQRQSGEMSYLYMTAAFTTEMVSLHTEPYSAYWHGIMDYFDPTTYPDGREEVFASGKLPCLWFEGPLGPVCGCPDITPQGQLSYTYCNMEDPINNPDCDKGYCIGIDGGGSNGLEDLPIHLIDDWVSFDGDEGSSGPPGGSSSTNTGGNNNNNNNDNTPKPPWDDHCSSFNGTLGTASNSGTPNDDNTFDIPIIPDPAEHYLMQLQSFINEHGLQAHYTAKELMQLVGEKCAVSYAPDVKACLKCHFISPFGFSDKDSWALADDFGIVADCIGSSDPKCEECKLSLHEMKLPDGNLLSSAQRSLIENHVDCDHYDCLLDNRALLERVLNFAEMEENAPNCTNSNDLEQILEGMDGCSQSAFTQALNTHYGVTWEPAQQVQAPTLTIGSTLCATIFDIQDVGDGIHSVGAISGLRFDVVNSLGQTETLNFDHLVLWADSDVNGVDCPVSSVANLMAQAVNQTIADIRVRMGLITDYSQIPNGQTFHDIVNRRLDELSETCVGHGLGGSSYANTTNNPAAQTAFCNASFVQLANNHISTQNGADCQ